MRGLLVLVVLCLLAGCGPAASPAPATAGTTPPGSSSVSPVTPAPSPRPSTTSAAGPRISTPEGWVRIDGAALAYSVALPPGSSLMESVEGDDSQGPYDQWAVASSPGTTAFGFLIGHDAAPTASATLAPAPPGGDEVVTADGVRIVVGEASGIDIIAAAVVDGYGWLLMAESGSIVGDAGKRELFLEMLASLRFERTEASADGRWAPTGGGFELRFREQPRQRVYRQASGGVEYDLVTASTWTPAAVHWAGWGVLADDWSEARSRAEAATMASSFAGTVASEGATTVGGRPGYAFVATSDKGCLGETGGCRIDERIVALDERRVVMFAVITAAEPTGDTGGDAFLASFAVAP